LLRCFAKSVWANVQRGFDSLLFRQGRAEPIGAGPCLENR